MRGDRGLAIIMTALLLVPLLMFAAFGVDLASWYARISYIQKSADAASLAGTVWMPDFATAEREATASLRQNGIVDGEGGIEVLIEPSTISPTALRVEITDHDADRVLSQSFRGKQRLTRSAVAEYNRPLPLGSPLNYFGGDATQTAELPGNPIAADRSPGFWAQVSGPGDVAAYGDAYGARCTGSVNTCAPGRANRQHRDTGYWYVVEMPERGATATDVRVFDGAYDVNGNAETLAGDNPHGGDTETFTTEFRVYRQLNEFDADQRVPVGDGAPSQREGSCWWEVGGESEFRGPAGWKTLCSINPANGERYLVNVRTTHPQDLGAGTNGYAVEAVSAGAEQPAVYALNDMTMRNNIEGGVGTFYLAEVGPQYAGKTLLLSLWDAGDASGTAELRPRMPSSLFAGPVEPIPSGRCSYTASSNPNRPIRSGNPTGDRTSPPVPVPTTPSLPECGITTTVGGTQQFNDEWLDIRIDIPASYDCTLSVNPEESPGSCWWGIDYDFTEGQAFDVTTWRARIEGNPVHLIE